MAQYLDGIRDSNIKTHTQKTIQTHNAVNLGINTWSIESTWRSCDGFDKLAASLADDGNFSNGLVVYWSFDGVTLHSQETIIIVGVRSAGSGITDIKAPYFKLSLGNTETAAAHTLSAWAFLKA